MPTKKPVPFLTQDECRAMIPCGNRNWYALIKAGRIPEPFHAFPGSRKKGFPEDQWAEILDSLREAANPKTAAA